MTIKLIYGIDISHIQNEIPEDNYYEYVDLICDLVEYDFQGYLSINEYSDNIILIVGTIFVKSFVKSNVISIDDIFVSSYDTKKCISIFNTIPEKLDELNEEIQDYNKEQILFIREWFNKNKEIIKPEFHLVYER